MAPNVDLRPATPDDDGFAFEVKRDAMGPYIAARWGWDEEVQRGFHIQRWAAKPWSIICADGRPVGTVSLHWQPNHLQFGEFYILAVHRRRGIGSRILERSLQQADARGIETRLEFLKWNPVGSLYLRHGFRVIAEDDIHYFAARSARAAQPPGGA